MNKRNDKDIDNIFLKIPFLIGLSESEKLELRKHIIIKDFRQNEIIFNEDDFFNHLYIILAGELKVTQISAEGKEHTLAIHKKWDFFGEMGLLDGKTTPAMIIAIKNCRICLINQESFFNIIMKNSQTLNRVIGILCMRLRQAWLKIRVMSFENADDRIRFALQELGEKFGIPDHRGVIIDFNVTQQNIANLSATSRETVSRFLSKATKENEIEFIANKKIILKNFSLKKLQ